MNTAARVKFSGDLYTLSLLVELVWTWKNSLTSDMTLDGQKIKRVMRLLVVPAWHKQPPPHSVPPFSRSQPHFLKQLTFTPKKSSAIGCFQSQPFSGICFCERSQNSEQLRFFFQEVRSTEPVQTHTHTCSFTHSQTLCACKPTHMHITWQHTK